MDIKIIEDAQVTYQRVCWHVVLEYNNKKYVILSDEDDNGGDVSLHEYDSSKRYNIGNNLFDEDLYEKIVETLMESGEMCSTMEKGIVI